MNFFRLLQLLGVFLSVFSPTSDTVFASFVFCAVLSSDERLVAIEVLRSPLSSVVCSNASQSEPTPLVDDSSSYEQS
ncbi:hypothetical protein ACFX2C_014445 [Malus domestica]